MAEMGISRACDNLAIELLKFFNLIRELNNFSWAYEGEVERIEEENDIFTLVLLK